MCIRIRRITTLSMELGAASGTFHLGYVSCFFFFLEELVNVSFLPIVFFMTLSSDIVAEEGKELILSTVESKA